MKRARSEEHRGDVHQVDEGVGEERAFPRLLRWMRESAGHTRAEMARRLGVSHAAIRKFESPESNPREEVLERYAAACFPGKSFLEVMIAGLGMMRGTGESMRRATAAAEQTERGDAAARPAADVARETWTRAAWTKARAERRASAGPFAFPLVLLAIRLKTGMGRTAWAALLGVSREQVLNYERPDASPGEATIKRYAAAAGRPWPQAMIEELEAIRDGRAVSRERVPAPPKRTREARRRGRGRSALAALFGH